MVRIEGVGIGNLVEEAYQVILEVASCLAILVEASCLAVPVAASYLAILVEASFLAVLGEASSLAWVVLEPFLVDLAPS